MTSLTPGKARFLLTIDPSLTCSGWALFSVKNNRLLGVGKVRSLSPKFGLASRFSNLQEQIHSLYQQLDVGKNDILVCEAPTTMRDPKAALKVEQVRGIFETLARQRGSLVPGRVNPRTVHFEILGLRGKQMQRLIVKDTARRVATHLYSDALQEIGFEQVDALHRHQDVVDALLIGSLVLGRIQRLAQARQPMASLALELLGKAAREA